VEKYCRDGQATDDSMAHAHCMLISKATDKHTLCNNHRVPTATMVAQKHLNMTLYVHCPSCFNYSHLHNKRFSC
jgi:hypothetical protein